MKKVPYHLGIIVDGNRRWAREKGLPTIEGHRRGLDNVNKIGKWCKQKGVKILTLFAFSTENWKRPKAEVNYLMSLSKLALSGKNLQEINKDNIQVKIIGQREKLSPQLQKAIEKAEELTQHNKSGVLNIALSYGGRTEIVEAIKKCFQKNPLSKITERLINQNLWTAGEPDPDLIIRTGGEQRMSNFLLWQAAYSELYFSKKYWPEFTEKDLDDALSDYAQRQRRFGE